MASKSVYQKYNDLALQHFGLKDSPYFGVITSPNNQVIEDVLVTQDVTTYTKIVEILKTPTLDAQTFKTKKKAFVLPLCPVTLARIKAACKAHGITMTNDYLNADFIITHNDFYRELRNDEVIPSTLAMGKLHNFKAYGSTNGNVPWIDAHPIKILHDDKFSKLCNSWRCTDGQGLYDEWLITGLALSIAYKVESKSIGILDVETLIHESSNKINLDDETINLVHTLLQSHDDDNIAMAGKIIPTIDYTTNQHLLWVLTDKISQYMYKLNRDKDVQYWKEQSDFRQLSRYNAQDMISYLEEKDALNKENFCFLEPICRKEIHISNRELYVFKVQVKQEYIKYLK